MAVSFNETNMTITPQLALDLGVISTAMGSAQLLPNGDYFFLAAIVLVSLQDISSYAIEELPTPAFDLGTQVMNQQGAEAYRAWRMPSLYAPPIT